MKLSRSVEVMGRIIVTAGVLSVALCSRVSPESIPLVKNGKAYSVVILGRSTTPTERHAAGELARYVKTMSGASLPIRTSDEWRVTSMEQTAILIGRAETNPFIENLVRQGNVKLSPDYPGLDGFIIKTIPRSPILRFSRAVSSAGRRSSVSVVTSGVFSPMPEFQFREFLFPP